MSMCVSPISVSEKVCSDPLCQLWAFSRSLGRPSCELSRVTEIDLSALRGVERAVAVAVVAHLSTTAALAAGEEAQAVERAGELEEHWDRVAAEVDAAPAVLAPKSHAFHMRLTSRNSEFFRAVQTRQQAQWFNAARFRSRFLGAAAQYGLGDADDALLRLKHLSDDWRAQISPRVPGLFLIERRAAMWAEASGRPDLAEFFGGRAGSLAGRNAPYPEDAPEVWAQPRSLEATLRFAVAATPLEWTDLRPRATCGDGQASLQGGAPEKEIMKRADNS
jgi:hypothetical protein